MSIEFIMNGAGSGKVAEALIDNDFDVNLMRPWKSSKNGLPYVNQMVRNSAGLYVPKPVCIQNTGITAALRKDDWIHLDTAIVKAAKPRLRAVGDLMGRGLQYTIPNGFGKTVLQYESMTDITEAEIALDPNKEGMADRPGFDITNLPLPIIFKDFWFSTRQIAASRNGGSPLDTSTAELAARRVAELAEKLLLGVAPSYKYGGGVVYGYTNYPGRMTKTLTHPLAVGWNPGKFYDQVAEMKEQSQNQYHHGPWVLYTSPGWDKYLDGDYSAAKGDITLRDRIKKIEGVTDVVTLDYLPGMQALLIQMTSDVIREVVGMNMMTVQWNPTPFRINFKVMAIMVPQLRGDINGNTGIVHGIATAP